MPTERANIDMGEPCINMTPFMNVCIHKSYELSEKEPVQECLIPNYYHVQELRQDDATSSATRTTSFSQEERRERELRTGTYIAFLQFITKVMVPHGIYTRYVQKKNLMIGDLVTTDDEALAFVIMDNCIEKWNIEYGMRKTKILSRIDEIIIDRRNKNSDNQEDSRHTNPNNVTPDKTRTARSRKHPGQEELNVLHNDKEKGGSDEDNSDVEEEPEKVYTKKDLEQLKGILHKDLLDKDDKNLLPITKYTEQRHDTLKMLVGWEGRGMKRFLEIKRNIKKFKEKHEATFQEIGQQSLANMAAEVKGCNERKNQRLTQYAKSEKEMQRKRDIEKVYEEEDLSPFAGNGNVQVWGI